MYTVIVLCSCSCSVKHVRNLAALHLRIAGLWLGMASGCFLAAGSSFLLMLLVDWDKEQSEIMAAQEHVRAQGRQAALDAEEQQGLAA